MNDQHPNPNVQKAVTFFRQAGLSRLMTKLREKYIELGQVGGQILLEDSSLSERREIASFLSKPPYRNNNLKVSLLDVDKALRQSGFGCTLPELLSAFFPDQPLLTRREQRTARAVHQADFRTTLLSIATERSEGSRGHSWLLQGLHGQEWLFSRYKNVPEEEQERQLNLVRYVASVLDQLPGTGKPERLAIFAQRTSGDPHALDPDRPAGRLLLLALHDLARIAEQDTLSMPTAPQDRAQELRLYSNAGLLVDTISSSVAVFNLAGAIFRNGTPDPLLQAAGTRVLLLPLRQLLEWQSVLPATQVRTNSAPTVDIYVFENPQVFEEVISESGIDNTLPTLVCTSGWPSAAALTLLDLLLAQSPGNNLHYSGDFDLKGLQIAAYLLARYPGRCHPWHFDPDSYTTSMQVGGVSARASELNMLNALPGVFAPLIATMQEHKKWAYQEGIVHLLAADVIA